VLYDRSGVVGDAGSSVVSLMLHGVLQLLLDAPFSAIILMPSLCCCCCCCCGCWPGARHGLLQPHRAGGLMC
jgi:hypothetical protein